MNKVYKLNVSNVFMGEIESLKNVALSVGGMIVVIGYVVYRMRGNNINDDSQNNRGLSSRTVGLYKLNQQTREQEARNEYFKRRG